MDFRVLATASMLAMAWLPGCTTAPPTPPQPVTEAPKVPRDEVTAAAITRVLAADHRSDAHRARDEHQHPLETLLFFGIKPDMTVAEVWPGNGGWYTEILAPLLAERGRLYAALRPAAPDDPYVTASRAAFRDKLAARPDLYGKVEVTAFGSGNFEVAPPGSADLVLTFGNLHAWMNLGFAPEGLAGIHRALKAHGVFGIVGHRADPAKPQDPRASNGYVSEAHAIELIEAAGFELIARSEINANPRDTRDYEQGVWALPPTYRAGNRDRERYQAIGESDRFTLKFRKR
jgi:predicted methyltransferase